MDEAMIDYLFALQKLQYAKVFELNRALTHMLMLTKNKVRPVKLPFPVIFIETTFTLPNIWIKDEKGKRRKVEKMKYYGLLVVEMEDDPNMQLTFTEKIEGGFVEKKYPNIFIFTVCDHRRTVNGEPMKGLADVKISLYKNYHEKYGKLSPKWVRERKFLRFFVMNFLDFLQNPEVQFIDRIRDVSKQQKRKRKGKMILPSSKVIRVTGVLKRYLNKITSGNKFTYSHRFWVRGHWRHYHNKRFTYMRGKKVWIPPFIKGSGILIDKLYRLVDRRQYTEEYYGGMLKGKTKRITKEKPKSRGRKPKVLSKKERLRKKIEKLMR